MSMDSDEVKLAKYFISTNLYQFTVFYNKNFDILFNYESPMAVASDDLKINASQLIQSDEIVYEQVKIVQDPSRAYIAVYEGNRIRVVVLLKAQAMNQFVEENIQIVLKQFADTFEGKYKKQLKEYETYTGGFDVTDILTQTLSLDMALPHIARYKGFRPEDRLEEYIFDAADKFCKVVGYLYIDNLIYLTKQHVVDEARNIVLTDPKRAKAENINPDKIEFPPDQAFYVAIFNLRKIGMLEPIKIDALGSFSKIQY